MGDRYIKNYRNTSKVYTLYTVCYICEVQCVARLCSKNEGNFYFKNVCVLNDNIKFFVEGNDMKFPAFIVYTLHHCWPTGYFK